MTNYTFSHSPYYWCYLLFNRKYLIFRFIFNNYLIYSYSLLSKYWLNLCICWDHIISRSSHFQVVQTLSRVWGSWAAGWVWGHRSPISGVLVHFAEEGLAPHVGRLLEAEHLSKDDVEGGHVIAVTATVSEHGLLIKSTSGVLGPDRVDAGLKSFDEGKTQFCLSVIPQLAHTGARAASAASVSSPRCRW